MLDRWLVDLIEKIGFVTKEGVRVKGAAAVACYTYATIKDFNPSTINLGREAVEAYLMHQYL